MRLYDIYIGEEWIFSIQNDNLWRVGKNESKRNGDWEWETVAKNKQSKIRFTVIVRWIYTHIKNKNGAYDTNDTV